MKHTSSYVSLNADSVYFLYHSTSFLVKRMIASCSPKRMSWVHAMSQPSFPGSFTEAHLFESSHWSQMLDTRSYTTSWYVVHHSNVNWLHLKLVGFWLGILPKFLMSGAWRLVKDSNSPRISTCSRHHCMILLAGTCQYVLNMELLIVWRCLVIIQVQLTLPETNIFVQKIDTWKWSFPYWVLPYFQVRKC